MKPWEDIGITNFTMFVLAVPVILVVFVVISPIVAVLFVNQTFKRYRDNVIKRDSLAEAHRRARRREA